jgi:hypothetical protein
MQMRRPSAFRQIDVTKAIKAARAAGVEVARVEIEPDGKMVVILVDDNNKAPGDDRKPNVWDKV